jgi:hypothetical protein
MSQSGLDHIRVLPKRAARRAVRRALGSHSNRASIMAWRLAKFRLQNALSRGDEELADQVCEPRRQMSQSLATK